MVVRLTNRADHQRQEHWSADVHFRFLCRLLLQSNTHRSEDVARPQRSRKAARDCRTPNFAFAVWLVILPHVVFAVDGTAAARRDANRQRISQMTPEERQRLEENAREFQQLPSDQQSKLRDLQQAIERDPGLEATLAEYQHWLHTLSPLQRSELRKAPDTKSRLALIDVFRRRAGPDPSHWPGDQVPLSRTPDQAHVVMKVLGNVRPPPVPPPSSEEFAALINVLESQLPEDRRAALHKMDAFTRQVLVVNDSLQRLRGGPERRLSAADEQLTQRLIEAFADGSPAEQFVKSQTGPARHMLVYPILFRGLITELILTVDLYFPSDDEVVHFPETLSPDERDLIAKQPEREWFSEVRLMCLESKIPGIREFRALSRNFDLMMRPELRRRMFDRGRPGQPPDGPRDPNRPEPDRNFGPDRSPPLNRDRFRPDERPQG